jgi:hypothetical protein
MLTLKTVNVLPIEEGITCIWEIFREQCTTFRLLFLAKDHHSKHLKTFMHALNV